MAQRPFKVLVADDTQASRALLRAYLGRLGFECVMASDGEEAVQVFERERPDVVLMDIVMPNVDGCEAIRRIRSLPSQHWVPIVIVSALDAEYDLVRGLESGADDYLTKPLSYQVFAGRMRNLVRTLELQRSREDAMQRLTALSDAVVDGIITFDSMATILNCNRAATEIFGESRESMIGKHFTALLAEKVRAGFNEQFQMHLEAGLSDYIGRQCEVLAQRRRNERFPMELCVTELPMTDKRLFIGVVRDISARKAVEQQLADNAERLQEYHDEAESEAELAKDIMDRHIRSDALNEAGVHYWVQPTTRFSGDIVLAAHSPSGRLYGVLADATGHGLAAAMSGLSAVTYFYQAVARDTPLETMVMEMNNALCTLLPSGRFMSAALVCLDEAHQQGQVWVGGVPDVLMVSANGSVTERFSSTQIPLGITTMEENECVCMSLVWEEGGALVLFSDGLIEAADEQGLEFGEEGVALAVAGTDSRTRLLSLTVALGNHLGDLTAHDDVSILMLELSRAQLTAAASAVETND